MNLPHQNLVKNLKTFFGQTGFKKGVVGLSGGVDSAVTFLLSVEALGKDNVTALILPEKSLSKQENIDQARTLAQKTGVRYEVIEITPFLAPYKNLPWAQAPMAKMNLKARVRMTILYNFANTHTALVLGTSNQTEIKIGYGTKYGDFAVDVEVIGSLYKKEVYALAAELNLPEHFLTTPPSAELEPNQTDEAEIGLTYAELDAILAQIEKGKEDKSDLQVQKILEKMRLNQHKTTLPVVISKM